MHQRKLAAKPQSKYTPNAKPSYRYPSTQDTCPICKGIKKKQSKTCSGCRYVEIRSPIDNNVYMIDGVACRRMSLTRGAYAIVYKSDYGWLSKFVWHATGRPQQLYAATGTSIGQVLMHTMIMGNKKPDHKNGNSLDNRRSNLRPATPAQNSYNKGPYGESSKYMGVCRDKERSKWLAQIKCAIKRKRYIKRFDDEIEAAKWRDNKATELFGEFARLNFPTYVRANECLPEPQRNY